MLKKIFTLLLFQFIVIDVSYAQSPVSALWQLSADGNATVSGDVLAQPQRLSEMQVSYSSGVQRSSPVGTAGTWPAETGENANRYMEFVVEPATGNTVTITSVSLMIYTNSGSGMRANIYYSTDSTFSTRTQIGSTLSLSSTAPSSPNVSQSLSLSVPTNEAFYVRIYPWYTSATTGKYLIVKSVTIAGTTLPSVALLPSQTVLTGFVQTASTTPSAVQSYTLSGTNLTENVTLVPPSSFELSLGGSNWIGSTDSLVLPVAGGGIVGQPKTIFVRLNAATAGDYSGTIIHRSGEVTAVVAVSGVFLAPEPTQASSLSISNITGTSAVLNFTGGNGLRRIVAVKEGTAFSWLPADGMAISGVNSHFPTAADQGNGTKIVYDGTGITVTITGLLSNTTYTVAVFEYDVATGNSYNYLTTTYPIQMFTTVAVPTISLQPTALNFGNVVVQNSAILSYQLSGAYLQANDTLTVQAPEGYTIALQESNSFSDIVRIPYSGQSCTVTLHVKFSPTSVASYNGVILHSGGGADAVALSVSGKGVTAVVETSAPVGFATLGGGTTGGAGGTSVIITDAQQLADLMKARENKSTAPLIVYITSTFSGYSTEISVKRTANISILGVGNQAGFNGFGMKIVECNNIIVRNLTFSDCHVDEKDALAIDGSHNVWVDHCTFTDSPANDPSGSSHDGQLDVKNGSYNVTLSYNHFMNHRKTCLLGHTAGQTSDSVMTVTYYRNWFDGTYSRHPRVRYAKAHIVNNLYTNNGGYGVGVTCDAQIYLDNNYFENVASPVLISQINDAEGTLSGDPAGYLKAVGNYTISSGAVVENLTGYWFNPADYYTYDVVAGSEVKALVQENAGAGILNITTDVETQAVSLPVQYVVLKAYPNPFNPSTKISFTVGSKKDITLKVFDVLGREVAMLFHGVVEAGREYIVPFSAPHLTSGLYLVVLQGEGIQKIQKIMLLK